MGDWAGAWGQAAACAIPASGVYSTAWRRRHRQPRLSSRIQVTQNVSVGAQKAERREWGEGSAELGLDWALDWAQEWTGGINGRMVSWGSRGRTQESESKRVGQSWEGWQLVLSCACRFEGWHR